ITLKDPQPFIMEPQKKMNRPHDKKKFFRNLNESGAINEISESILEGLSDEFTFDDLNRLLDSHQISTSKYEPFIIDETIRIMRNLGLSNYDVFFSEEQDISERVIFPMSPNQTNGIEDARFIRSEEEDGSHKYYA